MPTMPENPIPDELMRGSLPKEATPTSPKGVPVPAVSTNPVRTAAMEDLVMFGAIKHEVTIHGMRIVVKTLDNEEKQSAYIAVGDMASNSVTQLSALKDYLLSMAIESVNGMPLEYYAKVDKDLPVNERKLSVIKKMHTPLLNKLFDLYGLLEEKADKLLQDVTFDEIKNL